MHPRPCMNRAQVRSKRLLSQPRDAPRPLAAPPIQCIHQVVGIYQHFSCCTVVPFILEDNFCSTNARERIIVVGIDLVVPVLVLSAMMPSCSQRITVWPASTSLVAYLSRTLRGDISTQWFWQIPYNMRRSGIVRHS